MKVSSSSSLLVFPNLPCKEDNQALHDVQFAAAHTVHQAHKYRPITAAVISYCSLLDNTREINGKINLRAENELGTESLMRLCPWTRECILTDVSVTALRLLGDCFNGGSQRSDEEIRSHFSFPHCSSFTRPVIGTGVNGGI